jgi:hypothetical protein
MTFDGLVPVIMRADGPGMTILLEQSTTRAMRADGLNGDDLLLDQHVRLLASPTADPMRGQRPFSECARNRVGGPSFPWPARRRASAILQAAAVKPPTAALRKAAARQSSCPARVSRASARYWSVRFLLLIASLLGSNRCRFKTKFHPCLNACRRPDADAVCAEARDRRPGTRCSDRRSARLHAQSGVGGQL